MRAELVIKGKSLTGSSDLTLLAPIKPGLVPSLDAVTYKTRTKRLLKALQGGRASLHEHALLRPISDAVERVAKIHSFRVAVLEPEDKILLAVTFDGTWEAYIRVLWQKVGSLLDVIFCNSEGYVVSHDAGFDAWAGWVRRVQVETAFYYNTHGLTVEDARYLRDEEQLHRQPPAPSSPQAQAAVADQSVAATRLRVRTPEEIAWEAASASPGRTLDASRQALQSLAVLFRLTDLYLPGTGDGRVLQRAGRDILREFVVLMEGGALPPKLQQAMRVRFDRQLRWLLPQDDPEVTRPRELPKLPPRAVVDDPGDVQGGILRPYESITHGCLLLVAFDARGAGAGLLDELLKWLTTAAGLPPVGRPIVNVALTYEGLRFLGMPEEQLAWFPQEFREGMEARASMLGDFRANHPRRWRLPQRSAPAGAPGHDTAVELAAVHLVIQLRIGAPGNDASDPADRNHPLHGTIAKLFGNPGQGGTRPGVRLLAVEPLRRYLNDKERIQEHFGFADGDGQPVLDAVPEGAVYRNQVHLGELLLGYPNEADPAPQGHSDAERERIRFFHNGSFLVVRKLRQDVAALYETVRKASRATGLDEDLIFAKLMGRHRDGRPLIDAAAINDFDYRADGQGKVCPFHAHIRRANPRQDETGPGPQGPQDPPGRRRPRIMRRSMSYGPRYPFPAAAPEDGYMDDGQERGLMFMAYNASISEQFEVIQRWLVGGNSSGGFSGQSDSLLGVPEVGEERSFRFEHPVDGVPRSHRIALDAAPGVDEESRPYVRVEWGAYLFTPSVHALQELIHVAALGPRPLPVWSADDGEQRIQALLRLEGAPCPAPAIRAWKSALEDPEAQEKFISAGIWAAIREHHGGVLRTAYGVLVADRKRVLEVLGDDQHYTVAGYRERMGASIGQIYLGLDRDGSGEYERQSKEVNKAIGRISEESAFRLAYAFTTGVLNEFIETEKGIAPLLGRKHWELNLDAKEVSDKVLGQLCREWFGLPAARVPGGPPPAPGEQPPALVPGSWDWDWKEGESAIYPAQFTAPSRYIFQPHPGDDVKAYGERYGKALTAALHAFIRPFQESRSVPKTPQGEDAVLASAILRAFPDARPDDDFVARAFAGTLMGFLPTVDGNLRLSLNEWLRDGTFWSLRTAWAQSREADPYDRAKALLEAPLKEVMQLRPSPELVWRRVKGDGVRLGNETLADGDTVVLSLVSATQQNLRENKLDVTPIYGGRRSPDGPHPAHACPGQEAGMGVLLGLLAGLVDEKERMRPSPAPLAFTFDGRLGG
jgi:Dyp-type peroxidase family